MINVTTPQKDVVLAFFQNDIKLVKKYFMMISFDFDESFQYCIFKDFIFSAAGMMKDLDHAIYNAELLSSFKTIQTLDQAYTSFSSKSKHSLHVYTKEFLSSQKEYVAQQKKYDDLQAELQMLISKEQSLNTQLKAEKAKIAKLKAEGKLKELPKEKADAIKILRREHVDTVHFLGQRRNELDDVQGLLKNFEHEHKAIFMDFFKTVKEKLDYQYTQSLSFFGFEFNEKLFIDSEKSASVQKFKKEANIKGDLNLCKYVEYYLKNVNPDAIADKDKKEKLNAAKQYCKNIKERENLF
ncbi:MAG: hypothetical protein COA44_03115 [Arcobacter sp.]|nr:MAG: hypothetical protein COA44_03115 [Arcobacter sp.]